MFKVTHATKYRKDIRHAVTEGLEVGKQPHWARHKTMPMSGNSWNHLDITLCQHQTHVMISNVQRNIAFLLQKQGMGLVALNK
jgi:hypothetical protein